MVEEAASLERGRETVGVLGMAEESGSCEVLEKEIGIFVLLVFLYKVMVTWGGLSFPCGNLSNTPLLLYKSVSSGLCKEQSQS